MEQNWSRLCDTRKVESVGRTSKLTFKFCFEPNFGIGTFSEENREKYAMDISACLVEFPEKWMEVTHAIRMVARCICLEIHDAIQLSLEGSQETGVEQNGIE